jgi:hypothetical protein
VPLRPRRRRPIGVAGALVVMTLPLALARPAAAATYYEILRLQMSVRVLDDGVLEVTEDVTYQFVGSHTSRERVLKWPEGASLSQLEVGEPESAYRQGGGTDLKRAADPGTFGVETAGWRDALRVVWHFRATDESRTFRFTYRLHRVTVAHADVAEVAMWLWNPRDARGFADRAEAELELPGPADGTRFRVWALPGTSDRGPRCRSGTPAPSSATRTRATPTPRTRRCCACARCSRARSWPPPRAPAWPTTWRSTASSARRPRQRHRPGTGPGQRRPGHGGPGWSAWPWSSGGRSW